jgi:pyrimidine-nucleoside phosphorylase
MTMQEIIQRKKRGSELSAEQIRWSIREFTAGHIPDYQMAALLMAIWFRGMSENETLELTLSMLQSGKIMDLSEIAAPKVDKHSTGGVGDKVSLVLAPLAAAAGVVVPMISGRALGHTGGTLDKLQSIPGFRTSLTPEEFTQTLKRAGCCIMGQTSSIAPADGKLYALRDVTATVDCLPLMASSIMSKKLAEGCEGLVLDVKIGRGSFTPELEKGIRLSQLLIYVGRETGREVVSLLTDMDDPLGRAVGNSLEVTEAVRALRGESPADLREVTIALASEMLLLAGVESDRKNAAAKLERLLDQGHAFEKMLAMVEAQGGDPHTIEDTSLLPGAENVVTLKAERQAFVAGVNALEVGHLVGWLGAGRASKQDQVDRAVGVVLLRRRGEEVRPGDPIAEVHGTSSKVDEAARRLLCAFEFTEELVEPRRLVRARVDRAGATVLG